MDKREAMAFVREWLWDSTEDKNPYKGPWKPEQIVAMANMLIDFKEASQQSV